MNNKWGVLLDLALLITLSMAVICATIFVLIVAVLALIIRPVKWVYRLSVFIVNRSINWLMSPLNY